MRYRAIVATFLALCLSVLITTAPASAAEPPPSTAGMTYDDVRNTGLANNCPTLEATVRGSIPLDGGKRYKLVDLCIQPSNFLVKSEEEVAKNKRSGASFVPGKVMTRLTSSLDAIEGSLTLNDDGSVTFKEEDGIDFQAITVQIPGGEQFPMLFTVKNLVATTQPGANAINSSSDFQGEFKVPSYRTSNFLDPKGRGLTTGYESAVAIPSSGDDAELAKENVKRFITGKGEMSLQVRQINAETGEIAGDFESRQPSESDMGSKEPSDVKIRGIFYGRVTDAV
jgi:photosystem II oxygen-evolving enhancer protein 1